MFFGHKYLIQSLVFNLMALSEKQSASNNSKRTIFRLTNPTLLPTYIRLTIPRTIAKEDGVSN